jgi:predicted short-subunit dehydrogenase-like oxidoreductase (DUF2520 family)
MSRHAAASQRVAAPGLKPLTIGFVGSGRAAGSLARTLRSAQSGHHLVVAQRNGTARALATHLGADLQPAVEVLASADLTFLSVPDDRIQEVAAELASAGIPGRGRVVAHLSGSRGPEVLAPLARLGYVPVGIHPLQVLGGYRIRRGTAFAVEAPPGARALVSRVVADLGGVELVLPPAARATYHAAAAIAANLGMALLAESLDLMEGAGMDRLAATEGLVALLRGGLDATLQKGLPGALTGPVTRGDGSTIRMHLEALSADPELADAYRAVSRLLLRQAERDGRPATGAEAVRSSLEDPR